MILFATTTAIVVNSNVVMRAELALTSRLLSLSHRVCAVIVVLQLIVAPLSDFFSLSHLQSNHA